MASKTKKMAGISTAARKQKGRNLQQWTRDCILKEWQNVLQQDDIRSTSMGCSGNDILFSPLGKQHIELNIECKASKAGFTKVYDAYEQAKSGGTDTPIVILKQDRRRVLAVLDAELFFKVWRVWQRHR